VGGTHSTQAESERERIKNIQWTGLLRNRKLRERGKQSNQSGKPGEQEWGREKTLVVYPS